MSRTCRIFRLLPLLLLPLGACEFNVSTAHIEEVHLARSVGANKQAVDTTSSFGSSTPVLHCVVTLGNAPEGTLVRSVWRAMKVEDIKPGRVIDSVDVQAGGESNIIDFTLTPDGGLPPGAYAAYIYINPKRTGNSKPDSIVRFSVKSDGPRVAQAIISTNPEGGPAMTEVPREALKIFCHTSMAEAPPGTSVSASWVAAETNGAIGANSELDRATVVLGEGDEVVRFSLTITEPLPPGRYRVDIFINRVVKPSRSVEFTIGK